MKRVNSIAALAGAWCVLIMMLVIVVNIVGRRVEHPVPGAVSLAGVMLVAVSFLSLSRAEEAGVHIRVEAIVDRFSPNKRSLAWLFTYLLALSVYGLMTWATAVNAVSAWQMQEVITTDIDLPIYPAKTVIVVGCALMFAQVLLKLVGWVRKRRAESRNGGDGQTDVPVKGPG